MDGSSARYGAAVARLWCRAIRHVALGNAVGAGRLALCAHRPARSRQVYRQPYLLRLAGNARPQPVVGSIGKRWTVVRPRCSDGDSFGATLALRLKATDPRVERAVAIAPYAVLSNAVVNIYHEYTDWLPRWFPRQGIKRLPALLNVPPEDLDTVTVLARQPVAALFVAGGADKISPESEVRKLYAQAQPGSELVVVPEASHEAVTYYFNGLVTSVLAWLRGGPPVEGIKPVSARMNSAAQLNGQLGAEDPQPAN